MEKLGKRFNKTKHLSIQSSFQFSSILIIKTPEVTTKKILIGVLFLFSLSTCSNFEKMFN